MKITKDTRRGATSGRSSRLVAVFTNVIHPQIPALGRGLVHRPRRKVRPGDSYKVIE